MKHLWLWLLCRILYFVGHCVSKLLFLSQWISLPYLVYNYLMCTSCAIDIKYNTGLWVERPVEEEQP